MDRVRPRKLESPVTGGTQLDSFDTDLNPNEDYVDVRGVAIQSDTSNDEAVLLDRDSSGNMMFQDDHNAPVSLTDLTNGGFDIDNVVWDVAGGIVYDDSDQAVTRT